jgi:hypothetical protein
MWLRNLDQMHAEDNRGSTDVLECCCHVISNRRTLTHVYISCTESSKWWPWTFNIKEKRGEGLSLSCSWENISLTNIYPCNHCHGGMWRIVFYLEVKKKTTFFIYVGHTVINLWTDFKHLGDQNHREKRCYVASEFIALSLLVGIC